MWRGLMAASALLFCWLRSIVFCPDIFPQGGEIPMLKKLLTLLFVSVLAFSTSALLAQSAAAQEKTAKQGRWEGNVVRTSPDKSTLTVREVGSTVERTVHYDGGTRWVSQEHGSKKINDIDASQVKDGDRVIARGIWDKGVLYATLISKRLSH
jgi:hypothetical protein